MGLFTSILNKEKMFYTETDIRTIHDKIDEMNAFEIELNERSAIIESKKQVLINKKRALSIKENELDHLINKRKNMIIDLEKLIQRKAKELIEEDRKVLRMKINDAEKKITEAIKEKKVYEDLTKREIEKITSDAEMTAKYLEHSVEQELIKIDQLNGHDFEKYCASLLTKIGFLNTEVTAGSGDQGIDVLATIGKTSYGFQCKNYSSIVGNKAIQEVIAGKAYYKVDKIVVITNNFFSTSAKDLALQANVELWNRDTLKSLIEDNIN